MSSFNVENDRPVDEETPHQNQNQNQNQTTSYGSTGSTGTDTVPLISKDPKFPLSPVSITTKDYFERDSDDDIDNDNDNDDNNNDEYQTETQDLIASRKRRQQKRRRRRRPTTSQTYLRLCGMNGMWSCLAILLLLGIIVVLRSTYRLHSVRHVTPEEQLQKLNEWTTQALLLDDTYHRENPTNHTFTTTATSSDFVRAMKNGCRTTLLLMRHCEKPKHYDSNGHKLPEIGDHHCSIVGYEHAAYISTLFVKHEHTTNNTDPDNPTHHQEPTTTTATTTTIRPEEEKEGLLLRDNNTIQSLHHHPKYASPFLLYAMNPIRHGGSFHTYRQIETLTPLSQQANIPINSLYQEGDGLYLADDYFQNYLSKGKLCPTTTVQEEEEETTLATLLTRTPSTLSSSSSSSSSPILVPTTSVISWKHSDTLNLAHALGCADSNGCPSTTYDKHDFDQIWELQYEYHFYNKEENDIRHSNSLTYHYYSRSSSSSRQSLLHRHHHHHQPRIGYWTLQAKILHAGFQPTSKTPTDPTHN